MSDGWLGQVDLYRLARQVKKIACLPSYARWSLPAPTSPKVGPASPGRLLHFKRPAR